MKKYFLILVGDEIVNNFQKQDFTNNLFDYKIITDKELALYNVQILGGCTQIMKTENSKIKAAEYINKEIL